MNGAVGDDDLPFDLIDMICAHVCEEPGGVTARVASTSGSEFFVARASSGLRACGSFKV